jgi:CheY-like chemotaxis protein
VTANGAQSFCGFHELMQPMPAQVILNHQSARPHSPQSSTDEMVKPAAAPAPGLRILIAEDEALIAMAAEFELVERGHEVTIVYNGQAALDVQAQHGPFDVLVTDMQMPRLRGDELVRRTRAMNPGLPIVMMSANASPDIADSLRALGGPISILTKPVPFGLVADEIERLTRIGRMPPLPGIPD